MDFVFYDLETTGISPEFDQPLQFAAIWTDETFVEKARINIRCRLAPHILPSPQALIVTRVSPDHLIDPSLPSLLDFAQQVAELTERWSPSIWVGYNTMKFDEEVLRQTFYQILLPNVYAMQFNGNTRFDILPAVYAAFVRDPDLFAWPTDDTGRRSFKLDRLAPANGFNAHNAHDALGDVEATIHLARQFATRSLALWAELLQADHKAQVQSKLETFRPLQLVTRFGGGNPPHLGSTWQTTEQKEDLQCILEGRTKSWKSLDYDAGWFMKAADFGMHTKSVAAFVSTNSICQDFDVRKPKLNKAGVCEAGRRRTLKAPRSMQTYRATKRSFFSGKFPVNLKGTAKAKPAISRMN